MKRYSIICVQRYSVFFCVLLLHLYTHVKKWFAARTPWALAHWERSRQSDAKALTTLDRPVPTILRGGSRVGTKGDSALSGEHPPPSKSTQNHSHATVTSTWLHNRSRHRGGWPGGGTHAGAVDKDLARVKLRLRCVWLGEHVRGEHLNEHLVRSDA